MELLAVNHYEQIISDQIASMRGQKAYCLSALASGQLAGWEEKEYRALVEQYDQDLADAEARKLLVEAEQ